MVMVSWESTLNFRACVWLYEEAVVTEQLVRHFIASVWGPSRKPEIDPKVHGSKVKKDVDRRDGRIAPLCSLAIMKL